MFFPGPDMTGHALYRTRSKPEAEFRPSDDLLRRITLAVGDGCTATFTQAAVEEKLARVEA
jgi:hypothetical protein